MNRRCRATSGNLEQYPAQFKRQSMSSFIIGMIGLQSLRLFQSSTALTLDRMYAFDQREQLRDVMPVGHAEGH